MEDSRHHHPPPPTDRRPGALGDLQVLPDELLCDVLDRLDAPDVARLACVSSVMYILCNEEPLWMTLCLKDGGELEYKGSWKKTFLCRQNLITEVSDTCKSLLQFDGFSSLFLYKRWYRRFTTLDAFSMDYGDLERKRDLSLDDFHSENDGQNPVLFTELANTWPARNTWTADQLLLNYGDIAFRISQRSPKKLTMKFKDYVSYMELQHDEDPLYIFDDEFGEAAPGLLKDYDVPHLFQEDFFDVLAQDQRPPFRWLIIGPERSGASWHVDPALTSAWNTLLSGHKRWALYPPGKVPAGVTVNVNEEDGDVNIETPSSLQWWLDVYPLLANEDKPLECTQLPGETIFVPSGWWHCVLNLETTIAVTQNFVNISNFEFVCLDLAPGHVHKGVCRAGLLAVQGNDSQIDHLNHADMTQKGKRLRRKPGKESRRHTNIKDDLPKGGGNLLDEHFSYNIKFLSKFLDEDRDHYNSLWSPSNCIGQREMRAWLHILWVMRPDMRNLIWKGASLALNVEKWTTCMLEICASHCLPSPLEVEKFPIGTGSNPVYLVSDYVIKIFVEEGPEVSMRSLGTEVEFYSVLHQAKSPLLNHVPKILANGILAYENGVYSSKPCNRNVVPDMIQCLSFGHTNNYEDIFHFDVWNKMQFEHRKSKEVASTGTWPYLVTKRCRGEILANLRDVLSEDDGLNLASFLGCQLRNLHLLPVPSLQNSSFTKIDKVGLRTSIQNNLGEDLKWPKLYNPSAISQSIDMSPECEIFTTAIDRRRRDLVSRLVQWGDPIPKYLIEKVEEYVPSDIALFLNFLKEDTKDSYKFCGLLTWLHSDIMDDNIHMESCLLENCSPNFTVDYMVNGCIKEGLQKKLDATHILDFSNLSIGDPLNDLIPVYLDVFRGDSSLLKQLLANYGLPLSRKFSVGLDESTKKFQRMSYRAMCYCILHEENVLGAIFSLWKDLRSAESWEEIELAVWGELNQYIPTEDY